jgi:hypothetical protein
MSTPFRILDKKAQKSQQKAKANTTQPQLRLRETKQIN